MWKSSIFSTTVKTSTDPPFPSSTSGMAGLQMTKGIHEYESHSASILHPNKQCKTATTRTQCFTPNNRVESHFWYMYNTCTCTLYLAVLGWTWWRQVQQLPISFQTHRNRGFTLAALMNVKQPHSEFIYTCTCTHTQSSTSFLAYYIPYSTSKTVMWVFNVTLDRMWGVCEWHGARIEIVAFLVVWDGCLKTQNYVTRKHKSLDIRFTGYLVRSASAEETWSTALASKFCLRELRARR